MPKYKKNIWRKNTPSWEIIAIFKYAWIMFLFYHKYYLKEPPSQFCCLFERMNDSDSDLLLFFDRVLDAGDQKFRHIGHLEKGSHFAIFVWLTF